MRRYFLLLIVCLSTVFVGCKKQAPPRAETHAEKPTVDQAPPPAKPAEIDACSLLTSEEIQAVQGEPLKETKPIKRTDRGLAMSECFFSLPTLTNSISLGVGQRGEGPSARTPVEFWSDTFGDEAKAHAAKSGPPKKVEGIGDVAFWTGDDRMGALYVLAGDRMVRISVGGPGDQGAKIEKCKRLAEAVLNRL